MHRRGGRGLRATAIAMGLLAAMLLPLGPLGVDAAGAEYAHLNPPFADATTARASRDLGALSDFFTENAGQVGNPEILYYARGGGGSVGVAPGAGLAPFREPPPPPRPPPPPPPRPSRPSGATSSGPPSRGRPPSSRKPGGSSPTARTSSSGTTPPAGARASGTTRRSCTRTRGTGSTSSTAPPPGG